MPSRLKSFLQRWLITTLAVLVAANIVRGIGYDNVVGLLIASLLLGALNAFVRPIMLTLALPILVVTLGLFILVINALLLYFVGWLVKSFHVASFGAAFWGALVISLVSLVANFLTGTGQVRIQGRERRPKSDKNDSDGPVIDV
jgi:putative membrane protein